jgi:hypothetical protein
VCPILCRRGCIFVTFVLGHIVRILIVKEKISWSTCHINIIYALFGRNFIYSRIFFEFIFNVSTLVPKMLECVFRVGKKNYDSRLVRDRLVIDLFISESSH